MQVNRNPSLLVVYAACGLTPAVELAQTKFEAENPGKTINVISGQPAELVARVERGDVPDLLLFLGDTELGLLQREGYVDFLEIPNYAARSAAPGEGALKRTAVGDCRLVVAARADSPVILTSADDLLHADISSVAMAVPGATSVGSEAKSVLERAKLWKEEKLQKKLTIYQSPQDVLTGLAQGKATVAILYDPCPALAVSQAVRPESLKVVLALTGEKERLTRVKAGAHKRSPNSGLARRFVKLLASDEVAAQLAKGTLGSRPQGAGNSP
jgi:ABC-type molybdate transport system substrate-binding protein